MYEVLHGMTEAEVIGKTDYDIHAKEVADVFSANDQEVIAANRPLQFEEHFVTVDGRRDNTLLQVSALRRQRAALRRLRHRHRHHRTQASRGRAEKE